MQVFGIEAIELYIPKTFVDQEDLQKHYKVSAGKHTKGLGQLQLSFAYPFEDVNSISLTAVNNLMKNNNIHASQVGRLEVGTETLLDKSKSTKTVLMSLFQGFHDIEGASSINACYGGTNALINTLNWISSPSWDGRYGIVVAADVAVYEEGPARPTGGAGAIAILIGPKPKITFGKIRASFIDHQYDFYKPIPSSEYPVVDGKLSMDCYINALLECYKKLKEKHIGKNIYQNSDYFCFHTPFYKMIQKAFNVLAKIENKNLSDQKVQEEFNKKVEPSLFVSKRIGNIYTGSLYAGLFSLLMKVPEMKNKNVLLFSYGSGLCSTILEAKVLENPLNSNQIQKMQKLISERVKISAQKYSSIMLQKQITYGKFQGKVEIDMNLLSDNSYYLSEIDSKWRRFYKLKHVSTDEIKKSSISSYMRLDNLDKRLTVNEQEVSKFYKMGVEERREVVSSRLKKDFDHSLLENGGLSMEGADSMIENVIGKISLPLAVVPMMLINKKKYMVPMSVEEPSVVAACSGIAKFISPFSFNTSSTPSVMIGQVHLPDSEIRDVHQIMTLKSEIVEELNETVAASMFKRGGGVKDIRVRQLEVNSRQYSIDIFIDVCDAMGANITNTVAEKTKEIISKIGIQCGIAILTNYCLERKASSHFEIPIEKMTWKGVPGIEVAEKIIEAYQFAKNDKFRATTHNKGIMNGIDAVCVATGQDWRAIESSAHSYASRTGKYMPLTHYEIIKRKDAQYFRGKLEIPISVGSIGGTLEKNPIYKLTNELLGNPGSKELAEIIVTVGLAQNFAALRALAIEGIQKGHMRLHARGIAVKHGVPAHLIDECCKYMAFRKKFNDEAVEDFMKHHGRSKL